MVKYIAYTAAASILIFLCIRICVHANKTDHYQCLMFEEMKIVPQITDAVNDIFSSLMNAFSSNTEEKKDKRDKLIEAYQYHKRKTRIYSLIFIGFSTLLLLLTVLYLWKMDVDHGKLLLIRWIIFISFLSLIIGIVAPFLKIVVSKEIGNLPVVFKYNTKSIVSTIVQLSTSNIFLCLLILLCSIVIPVVKLLLTYTSTHGKNIIIMKKSEIILKIIGKWAMTDVFVVAILLSFLSLDGKDSTKCILDYGFYYFTAYCLFSFACMFLINNTKKEQYNY